MADTMVEGSKAVNPTIPVATKPQESGVPGDYHNYSGINSKSEKNSYDSRSSKLEDALGIKDTVKG